MRAPVETESEPIFPPVAITNVPPIARMIAIISVRTGGFLFLKQVKTRIIAGERYCKTVAMPAFES